MTAKKPHPRVAAIEAATRQFEKAREAIEQAIYAAYRDPTVKRTEIAPASPWTAAHVRKLARDHGIEADPAYKARTEAARKRAAEHAIDPEAEAARAVAAMKPLPVAAPAGIDERLHELPETLVVALATPFRKSEAGWYQSVTKSASAKWKPYLAVTAALAEGKLTEDDLTAQ